MKSRKIIHLALVLLTVILFDSCEKKEDQSRDLIINGNVESGLETPNGWWQSPAQDEFSIRWSEEASSSPKKSLSISKDIADAAKFAYWGQVINDNIPVGKELTLSVNIKSSLIGDGVSIAIRGDSGFESSQFVTTEGAEPISGVFDWKQYKVKLTKVDSSITSILVFLIYLPDTKGEVYFDDISLTY